MKRNRFSLLKLDNILSEMNMVRLSYCRCTKDYIYISTKFGICKTVVKSILGGSKPTIMTAVNKTEFYINQAKSIHKDRYDYSKVNYVNLRTPIIIICKKHGEFLQTPDNHLYSNGCSKCRYEKHAKGWRLSEYVKICGNRNSNLYLIKVFNDDEKFLKIGITVNDINKRYNNHSIPYNYDVVKIISKTPEIVYKKEKEILKNFKKHKYVPKLVFPGNTECIKYEQINELINLIDLIN